MGGWKNTRLDDDAIGSSGIPGEKNSTCHHDQGRPMGIKPSKVYGNASNEENWGGTTRQESLSWVGWVEQGSQKKRMLCVCMTTNQQRRGVDRRTAKK